MDVLTDVLRSLQFESALVFRADLTAPWGLRLAGRHSAAFHYVLRGRAEIVVEGSRRAIRAEAGDLVALPRGRPHIGRDEASSPLHDFDEIHDKTLASGGVLRFGGGGAGTSIISACFDLGGGQRELLRVLPAGIHLLGTELRALPWLEPILASLTAEAGSAMPGSGAVLNRLSEVVFIHVIRSWLLSHGGGRGWVGALRDPQLARALAAAHDDPGAKLSVASLATAAGLSRSAFAARFKTLAESLRWPT